MPETGSGGSEALRVVGGGSAGREEAGLGARTGVGGGVSEIADHAGELGVGGEIFRVEICG